MKNLFVLAIALTAVFVNINLNAQTVQLQAVTEDEKNEFDLETFEELVSLSETEVEEEQVYENNKNFGIGSNGGKMIQLTAGTLIYLELNERIFTEKATVGKVLQFKVKMNVMKDRKALIKTGAMALGRVKAIQPATYNNPAEITIELTSVQAVDGQQVALMGNEQSLRGEYPNQGTVINTGTSITATVTNDMNIETL